MKSKLPFLFFLLFFTGCRFYHPISFREYIPDLWSVKNNTQEPLLGSIFKNIFEKELNSYLENYSPSITPHVFGLEISLNSYNIYQSLTLEGVPLMGVSIYAVLNIYNECEQLISSHSFSSFWEFPRKGNIPETETMEKKAAEDALKELSQNILHFLALKLREVYGKEKKKTCEEQHVPFTF